jgi:hypothetical protein
MIIIMMKRDQDPHLSRQDKDQNEQNGGCRNDGYGQFSLSDTI